MRHTFSADTWVHAGLGFGNGYAHLTNDTKSHKEHHTSPDLWTFIPSDLWRNIPESFWTFITESFWTFIPESLYTTIPPSLWNIVPPSLWNMLPDRLWTIIPPNLKTISIIPPSQWTLIPPNLKNGSIIHPPLVYSYFNVILYTSHANLLLHSHYNPLTPSPRFVLTGGGFKKLTNLLYVTCDGTCTFNDGYLSYGE